MRSARRVAIAVVLAAVAACGDSHEQPRDLEGLTQRLIELDHAYWARGEDGQTARELVQVARERAPLWEQAVRGEPARALATVVPPDIAVALPPDALPYVEQAYEHTDLVTSYVADDLTARTATYELAFDEAELFLAPGVARPRHHERFTARGYRLDDVVLVTAGGREPDALAGIQWASGEKVLAVMMSFSDKSLSISTSSMNSALSGTASFYSSISAGTVSLSTATAGPYTMDVAANCNFSSIQLMAYRALAAAGIDSNAYNQIVAVVPSNGCGWTGKSEIGQASNGRATFSVINDTGALTHELGHAHGLYHAHSLTCTSDLDADETGCVYADYGHPTDIMGAGGGVFSAYGLEMLGYLGRSGFGMPTTVTATGTYTLYPLAGTTTNTRVLKIPYQKDSTSGWTRSFYVEYHVATGPEAYLSATSMNQKVFVTLATEGDGDTGYFLKAIGTGESFTAPNGMVITIGSADATSASVTVTMPTTSTSGCVRAAPSILILEQSVETPNAAGSTTQYQLEIWNKDSSECGPSKFSVSSADLPSGWSLSATDVLAYGGGGLGNALIYVTSPNTVTTSTSFTVTVADASVSSHTKSATLTYVPSSCTAVAPTVTLQPTTGMTVSAGGTTNYLLSFTNNNSSSCGTTSVSAVTGLAPSGWTVSPASQSFSVAAGETVTQAVSVTASATATGTSTIGTYLKYLVNSHNYYTSVASTTATIGTSCVHTPPQVTISPTSQTSLSMSELDYTVTVKNLDGANCASTAPNTISVSVALPSGLTGSLDATSFSLAQGATGTTTLRLTPSTSTAGSYVATVTASNAGVTSSAKATYKLSCGTIAAATLSLSPSTQSGQPGDTLAYGVTITNPNTSTLCGSRTYTLTSTVTNLNGTSGWTTSLAANSVTLASGESTSTTLYVTSPTNAAAPWAVYKPQVRAVDDLGNGITKSVFYAITCESNPPTLAFSPASATTQPGSDVPFTVTITDNDTYGCPWTMTLGSTLPTGWTESTLPTDVTLSGGSSTTVTWTPHVPTGAADGAYLPKLWIDNAGVQTSGTATVNVACSHAAPTVALSPSSQSGTAGSALDYTVTVTNNDDSKCGSQSFALASAVPTGWSGSLDTASVTLAPGASTTATLTATSSSSATGTNTISVTATGSKSGAASGSASYVVPCTTAKPTVSLSPSSQSGAAGGTLSYTATITNKNSGCAAETFTVAAGVPSGWTGSVSSTAVSLASGASTTVTLGVTSAASATGTNSVSVSATGVAGTTTGSASYVVACTRAAPTVTLSPGTQTASPGVATSYTATITNKDTGCSSGTFTVAASVPSGWTGSVSSTSVTLAAGASTTVTLNATAPTSASGTNSVGVTASNAASGSTTGTASFVVTCTRGAPSVTLSPSSQSGTAGSALSYTATVKNNDSGCASGTFALSATVPSGWTGSVSPTALTLASGASSTTTLSATSAAGATGTNTVSVTASNAASGSTTGSASYVITTACTRAPPTVTLSPTSQSGTPGSARTYTMSVTNNDSAGCASGSFALTVTAPSVPPGWTGALAPTSLSLAAGASGTSTLTVTSPAMVMAGTYSFSATATSASSGAASASGSYVVAACTRGAPTVSIAPVTQSGSAGSALAYTVTVTNNDSAACASGTFSLVSSVPASWSGALSPTSLTLAAGAAGTLTFTVTSAAGASAGANTITATASNAASGSGSGTATYTVTVPCVRSAPSVAITPTTQSGTAGSALAYSVSVTNNDSAGCATGSFTVTPSAPAGWTASVAASTLTLAPAASASTTLTATSAGTANPASYTLGVTATSASSGSASASATYTVVATCVRTAPSVALTPASQSGTAGTLVTYTATITNNDAGCSSSTFNLTGSGPTGWTVSPGGSAVTLGSGASTQVTLSATSAASATAGTYSVSLAVESAASGTSMGAASYVVVATCTRGTPTVALAPSTQSSSAGGTLTYTATITNHDSACGNGTFAVSASGPAGWTLASGQSTVTLASGASAQVTVTATSTGTASAGTYSVTATAANAASGSGSGAASYVVTAVCTHATPSVSVSPASQSAAAGGTLSYTVTVANLDAGCAPGSFALTASVPSGWTSTFASTPLSIAAGASATTTWSVGASGTATPATSTLSVTATDAASGSASANATFTVTPTCVTAKPSVVLSPASQSTVAGGTLTYTATVTNNDVNCAAQSFALTHSEPTGLTGSLGISTVSLAAGASTTVSYQVATLVTAPLGDSTLSLTATGTSGSGTGTATATLTTPCVRMTPAVAIAPSSQTGVPGSALVYTATLTNRDVACGSSTFAIASVVPAGWSAAPASSTVKVASGSTATVAVTVTSPLTSVGEGTLTVTGSSGASGTGAGSATYVIACSHAAPVVALSPAVQTADAGAALTYDVMITNASIGCADETVSLAAAVPDGWTAELGSPFVVLAASATAATTLTVTSAANAAAGDATITLTATGAQAGSADAIYTVRAAQAGDPGGCAAGGGQLHLALLGVLLALVRRRRR